MIQDQRNYQTINPIGGDHNIETQRVCLISVGYHLELRIAINFY